MKSELRPDFDTLYNLYITQRLTTRQIARQTGARSKTSVIQWLKSYDIPCRPAGYGLLNRGVIEPTKEELVDMVRVQHLGYREIAARFGVDYTAIPHWLKKHDIARPSAWDTRRKGQHPPIPTKEELTELYAQGKSLDIISQLYGVSDTTISKICKQYGIEVNPGGFDGGKRFQCNDDHLVRSVYEQRVDNWLFEHGISHVLEPISAI